MQPYRNFRRQSSQNLIRRAEQSPVGLVRHSALLPDRQLSPFPQRRPQSLLKLADLLMVTALFLATLACTCTAFVAGQVWGLQANSPADRQVSRQIFMQTTLATLTPTIIPAQIAPLPTLAAPAVVPDATPLPLVTAVVLTTAVQPGATAVSQTGEGPPLTVESPIWPAVGPITPTLAAVYVETPALDPVTVSETATQAPAPPSPTLGPAPTETPLSTVAPTASPTLALTWTPTPTASPTQAPTATPVVTPLPADWTFVGVQVQPDDGDGLLLVGHLINNTTSIQEIEAVTGTFYDAQGQVIAGSDRVYGYWPVDLVLPGGGVPFELLVEGIDNAADFDLGVEAEPSQEDLIQDFDFKDLNQRNEGGDYCLAGKVQPEDEEPRDYIVIVAILYDTQGQVVGFGDNQDIFPEDVEDGQAASFEMCVPSPDQAVARYDVLAWGQ